MATYYVRKTGNDSNAGTSAGASWLTVDKAANTVAAGDTVYIGAGAYRELVTMDTSGSSGSIISYIGDITGTYTGDAGLVIISAHDSDNAVSTRASVVDFNGKAFFEWKNCTFVGGTSFVIGNTAYATATAYEGVVIENCVVIATSNTYAIKIELNAGATPTASGLKLLRNTVQGGIDFDHDTNGTAHLNTKILIDSNRIFSIGGNEGINIARALNGGSFGIGGMIITHNTIFSSAANGIYTTYFLNTTNPTYVYGNTVIGATTVSISFSLSTSGAVISSHNVTSNTSSALSGTTEIESAKKQSVILLGGLHDQHLYQAFGYSPFMPFEPMTATGYTSSLIDAGHNDYAQALDSYGNSRNMGRATSIGNLYYMDGSDAAVTDPNAVWTSEANVVDADSSTYGSVNTTGSTNYVKAEGTNAPSSGSTITKVQARVIHATSSSTATGIVTIYSDGEAETLATLTVSATTTVTTSSWTDLSTPSGGWTWAKVQALEFKAYRSAGAGTLRLYQVQIGAVAEESTVDIGAVEARTRLAKETTTVRSGTYAGNFTGAGYHDFWVPVDASSTTISVYAQYDSNYVGSKPKLEVFNIPGVADQSDTVAGSANTWEQLSVTFTPTSAGVVRVRISSQDASTNGKCFFDDMGR